MIALTAFALVGGSSAFVVLSRPAVPSMRLVMNMNPGQDHKNPNDFVELGSTWG